MYFAKKRPQWTFFCKISQLLYETNYYKCIMRRIILISLFGCLISCLSAAPSFKLESGWRLGHTSLSYDEQTIYFSAIEPGRLDFQIYKTHQVDGKWSKPIALPATINTDDNEDWPCINYNEQDIYFVRNHFIMKSHYSNGQWSLAETLTFSSGGDIAPSILSDDNTFIFASNSIEQQSKHAPYSLYVTHKVNNSCWMIPTLIRVCDKKDTTYTFSINELQPIDKPNPIVHLSGSIDDQNGHSIAASIKVYNSLTTTLIAELSNQSADGRYAIALPSGGQYSIDYSAPGYTHHYFDLDLHHLQQDSSIVENVKLCQILSINVNIFDSEMQLPISDVDIVLNAGQIDQFGGSACLSLPIGDEYTVTLSKKGYVPVSLTFDTRKPVLLPSSELDIELSPDKAPLLVSLQDAATAQELTGDITLTNLNREEKIVYDSQTKIRQGDEYHLSASVVGYMFIDTSIVVPYSDEQLVYNLKLQKIEQMMIMQLKDIYFELNSAEIMESSYEAVNRVVDLMNYNPNLQIELSAHTDDQGSTAYNNRLSQKRGEAVKNYIVLKGIAPERIQAIGYGETRPLVPNDSEEHRAINRRVECKVLGI